jgi:hypothetical protein
MLIRWAATFVKSNPDEQERLLILRRNLEWNAKPIFFQHTFAVRVNGAYASFDFTLHLSSPARFIEVSVTISQHIESVSCTKMIQRDRVMKDGACHPQAG